MTKYKDQDLKEIDKKLIIKNINDTILVSLRNSIKKCNKDIKRFDKKKFENKRIAELYIYSMDRFENLEIAYTYILKQIKNNI